MDRPLRLLVNPSAGGGRAARLLPQFEAALRAHGLDFTTAATRDLEHARALARAGANEGAAVATLSGDGMLGAVADVLREIPGAVLGVLPGGRGNDLARVLGIPREPAGACEVIAAGHTRELDLAEVGGRAFIGIASLGFDSDANRIANEAPARLGKLVYAYGALRALSAWRPARFEVTLAPSGERRVFVGYSVAAANSKAYGGGMYLAPDAELDDGLLDIVVIERIGRLQYLARLPSVFSGRHVNHPNVHVLRAAEVTISADRPFTVYADGDPIGELPVTVRSLPRCVSVLAPAAGR